MQCRQLLYDMPEINPPNQPMGMQTFCIRMSQEMREEVARIAAREERQESWVVRKAIEAFIAGYEAQEDAPAEL